MCDKAQFDASLSNGVPLCIEDTDLRLQGEWEPQAFIQKYGWLPIFPLDCLTGELAAGNWTVGLFFDLLLRGDLSRGVLKLKVSTNAFLVMPLSCDPR